MRHEESRKELTDIMTKDIMKFVEIVVRKRVGLLVDEIYNGVTHNMEKPAQEKH